MIKVNEIKLRLSEDNNDLMRVVANQLHLKISDIKDLVVTRKAIDSRNKDDIRIVYNVSVSVDNEEKIMETVKSKKISLGTADEYQYNTLTVAKPNSRPIIIGTGPAGLFCGLVLANAGLRPILIERGGDIKDRKESVTQFFNKGILDCNSNIQFGLGGAGTFSDGKLNTGTKDIRQKKVLSEFIAFGAPDEIMYLNKPHIGTDKLVDVVSNMRDHIISQGGEFYFNHTMTDITMENDHITEVITESNKGEVKFTCQWLVLAIGHSARDTFYMLNKKNIPMTAKNFSVGVRIEHHQELINRIQYGNNSANSQLGAADYKLSCHLPNGRSIYTFCICPGGEVVGAASEEKMVVTNGMSEFNRDKANANSALLVSITPEDYPSSHPLAGVEYQRQLEQAAYNHGGGNYHAPIQLVADFLDNKPSTKLGNIKPTYKPGYTFANLWEILPNYICESLRDGIIALDRKMKGFNCPDAVLTAVETRSSSPVRILRDENYQSAVNGLFLAGEGVGYAGGIMSSAVDGIKCGEAIICQLNNSTK